jgi:hypothetical protein
MMHQTAFQEEWRLSTSPLYEKSLVSEELFRCPISCLILCARYAAVLRETSQHNLTKQHRREATTAKK